LAFLLALLVVSMLPASAAPKSLDESVLRSVPIQNGGRLKPIDTFARETVFTITGRESFEGRTPLMNILGWMSDSEAARKAPVIDVSRQDVRRALDLPDARWISADALLSNPKFEAMGKDIVQKEQSGEELSELEKQEARLMARVNLFTQVVTGDAWTVIPSAAGPQEAWTSLAGLASGGGALTEAQKTAIFDDFRALVEAYRKDDNGAFVAASEKIKSTLGALGPGPDPALIQHELLYNDLHPFELAWALYLSALLVLAAGGALRSQKLYWVGYAIAVGGLIVHAYGFYLRCTVAGRPPVTNMYESVIWVSFGAMFFALVLEAIYRGRALLMAATAAATICLIIADNTSSVLDPAINPLTPVLRNNFWLTIHVLTITLSYAAFLLATGIGHVSLWAYGFRPDDRNRQRALHAQLYKVVQIGVLLLAAGTILGGVWANYSWGRFWGWDPKEVWALIALLGYLAVIHGRYAGWLKDFGFAAGSVVAYCGVLMAWYGVNFVLGAGLHSYGFGDGGQKYVAAAVGIDLVFVGLMAMRWKAWRQSQRQDVEAVAPAP
jgi:ABC-type transport system involved in cytochrome c biogenesis permease subunit